MVDKKITDLPAADPLTGSELYEIVQAGANKKALVTTVVLTADRTYYVRADGDDANDGLTDSSGGAFLTVQHAIDVIIETLDLAGFDVYVQIGAGTFAGVNIVRPAKGEERIRLVGTGAGTVLDAEQDSFYYAGVYAKGYSNVILITYVQIIGPGGGYTGLWPAYGARIAGQFIDYTFGSGDWVVYSEHEGYAIVADSSVSGVMDVGFWAVAGGFIDFLQGLTFIGTPDFETAVIRAEAKGIITTNGFSVTGGATGKKFEIVEGSSYITNGQGDELPGDVEGTVDGTLIFDGAFGSIEDSASPDTGNFPNPGTGALFKNTTADRVYVAYNDEGTIKSVELLENPIEVLTADRTYYVRSDGNDLNTGLVDSAGGAFLTLGKAAAAVASIDWGQDPSTGLGYQVTIQIGAGTFAGAVFGGPYQCSGRRLLVDGAGDGVTIIQQNINVIAIEAYDVVIRLTDLTLQAPADYWGVLTTRSDIEFVNCGFISDGYFAYLIDATDCRIYINGNTSISGDAGAFLAVGGGSIGVFGTVTLTGTPDYSPAFLSAYNGCSVSLAATYVGSATGKRFVLDDGSIATGSDTESLTSLPGDEDGTVGTGAHYGTLLPVTTEVLTADRTYYVRTDGDDANDGLANTSGEAFLTIQHAVNVALALDFGLNPALGAPWLVNINVGAGTFDGFIIEFARRGGNEPDITIQGAGKASTIIERNGDTAIYTHGGLNLYIRDCTIKSDSTCVEAGNFAQVAFLDCAVETTDPGAYTFYLFYNAIIELFNIEFIGDADTGIYLDANNCICFLANTTITGTPDYGTAFLVAYGASVLQAAGSITGSATGKRFELSGRAAVVFNVTESLTYFPGDVAGTVEGGSRYGSLLPDGVIAKTGAYTLLATDHGTVFTNEGASAIVPFTLLAATAAQPLEFTFYVQNANGVSISSLTGDSIRIAGGVSGTAEGQIESTEVGSSITLRAINATEWVAVAVVGTWTVTDGKLIPSGNLTISTFAPAVVVA